MELGSEFNLALSELSVKNNNFFAFLSKYNNVIYFDSGRSALKHLMSCIREDGEILLPEFICESVTRCFKGKSVRYYRLNRAFEVDINDFKKKVNENTKVIYLMHYFGKVQQAEILDVVKRIAVKYKCIIIEDTSHSIFSDIATIGDYQICSIRKWLPIPKGGVLYAKDDKLNVFESRKYKACEDNDRAYGMILKDIFLKSNYDCNTLYRHIFSLCEKRLDEQTDVFYISEFAHYILSCVGIDELIETRIMNYQHLKVALNKTKISLAVSLKEGECPLVLPIWVKERNQFRSYLMEHRVYCAVHWPFDGLQEEERPFAKKCAQHLLSLPLDQRYGQKEINYLIDVICGYEGDLSC